MSLIIESSRGRLKVVIQLFLLTVVGLLSLFRYDIDFLHGGSIGGDCEIDKDVINSWDKNHRNALQSWYVTATDNVI